MTAHSLLRRARPNLGGAGALMGALLVAACPKPATEGIVDEIGTRDRTDQPPPGLSYPIVRGDLAQISQVGRWIDRARRSLVLAHDAVVSRMGDTGDDLVVPLVDVDPGGNSAQVLFVRWPGGGKPGAVLEATGGQRWVLVSLALQPDRIVDMELLRGDIEPGSTEARRLEALLQVGAELQRQAPGRAFFTIDRFVQEPTGDKRRPQRIAEVVYAMATGPGPDFELAVDEPPSGKRKRNDTPPALLRTVRVHSAESLAGPEVLLDAADPHPLTVARAMARGPEAGPLVVRAGSGRYEIRPSDGAIERRGAEQP